MRSGAFKVVSKTRVLGGFGRPSVRACVRGQMQCHRHHKMASHDGIFVAYIVFSARKFVHLWPTTTYRVCFQ